MSELNVLNRVEGVNGTHEKPKGKPRKRTRKPAVKPVVPMPTYKRWVTVAMGCGIPTLSLSLSSIGGALIENRLPYLGAGALALTCGVLAVSLSHLAAAIRDITKSAVWQAWALAVVIDCSLVVCELTRVAGFASWVVPAVMIGVTAFSMLLSCHAFLNHD